MASSHSVSLPTAAAISIGTAALASAVAVWAVRKTAGGAAVAKEECKCEDTDPGTLLCAESLNAGVLEAKYAVRGELVIRAKQLQKELAEGDTSKPFSRMVFCNIGNPQALNQTPLTFPRQVLALLQHTPLLDAPGVEELFPADVLERARSMHAQIPGGIGAYSVSQGLPFVRKHVAEFIEARDGFPANPDHIFLTAGASPGVQHALRMLIRNKRDAIMVPIPQYPLYSGTIALYGGSLVGYELTEGKTWDVQVAELQDKLAEATSAGLNVRAIVVINPGNPTGNCLSRGQQNDIVSFCQRNKMVLMADEVYQENVYEGQWTSFKRVACEMGVASSPDFQLISFHSVSKGFLGECGRRGGYMELVGIPPAVIAQFVKLASLSLCPNVVGQVMVDLMVKPPQEGDASFEKYNEEKTAILMSLRRRAARLASKLNALEGVTCAAAQGAMYVFPKITLPPAAVAAATKAGKSPDTFYCLRLLEATGLVVVPGSGFRQASGTWHFRCTFLPPEEHLDAVIDELAHFHAAFLKEFSS